MNRLISPGEFRLGLRLILKQPILSLTVILALATGTSQFRARFITPGWMPWVEASPLSGRTLIPADGAPGAEPVVLVGESLWQRRYAGDPNLIGRQLTIGGQSRTVVGIMPDSFRFPGSGELWLPLNESSAGGAPGQPPTAFPVFGVLRPKVSFEAATTELTELSRQFPTRDEPEQIARVVVRPFTGGPDGASLAASAFGIMRYVGDAYMSDRPFWTTLEPTWRTIAFTAFLALLVSAVAGLWPALRVTRHDLRNTLQAGRGFAAGGFGRVGAALLVVEIALSVGLLNGAVTSGARVRFVHERDPGASQEPGADRAARAD